MFTLTDQHAGPNLVNVQNFDCPGGSYKLFPSFTETPVKELGGMT